jgi:hypothetical protein
MAFTQFDKDNAEELFLNDNWSKQRIAMFFKTSANTITKWGVEGEWDEKRLRQNKIKKSLNLRIYEAIDYQMEVIEDYYRDQRKQKEKNGTLLKELDKGQVDALSKLSASIKTRELTLVQSINFLRKYHDFVKEQDELLAQKMFPYSDNYIQALRELSEK